MIVDEASGLLVDLLEQMEQLRFGELAADLQQLVLVEQGQVENLRKEHRLGLRALVCGGLSRTLRTLNAWFKNLAELAVSEPVLSRLGKCFHEHTEVDRNANPAHFLVKAFQLFTCDDSPLLRVQVLENSQVIDLVASIQLHLQSFNLRAVLEKD